MFLNSLFWISASTSYINHLVAFCILDNIYRITHLLEDIFILDFSFSTKMTEEKPKRQYKPRVKKERSESQKQRDKDRMARARTFRGKKEEEVPQPL